MKGVDIHVLAGEVFTMAQVRGHTVAILWGKADNGPHFVSDGHGAPTPCASHAAAEDELMRIALAAAGGGAATVIQTPEASDAAPQGGAMTAPIRDDEEYGVRSYDPINGERTVALPTLAMAEDSARYRRSQHANHGHPGWRVEIVRRFGEDDAWSVLTDDDVKSIKREAWEGLDEALTAVVAAGLDQLADQHRTADRPKVIEGGDAR